MPLKLFVRLHFIQSLDCDKNVFMDPRRICLLSINAPTCDKVDIMEAVFESIKFSYIALNQSSMKRLI